jgi:hypothetical protein
MTNHRNYPQQVADYAFKAVRAVEDSLEEEEIGKQELFDAFGEELMKKFLSGEPLELDEASLEWAFEKAMRNSVFNSLIKKGVIDVIENQEGEEIYFLTQEGKQLRDALFSKDQKQRQ